MYTNKTVKTIIVMFIGLGLAALALIVAKAAYVDASSFDLAITLKSPAHVTAGGQYEMNLAYENLGDIASPADTWVRVNLPDGVIFVTATDQNGIQLPPDEIAGGSLLWSVGSLPAGSCCSHIWISVNVDPGVTEDTSLTTQAEIGSSATDTNPVDNLASATSVVCDMAGSTKQAQGGSAKPGDTVTYTITLSLAQRTGPGAVDQRLVTLVDILPPTEQARFLGWVSSTTGTYDGQELRWQGNLRVGVPVKLQYRLGIEGTVPTGTIVMNHAHLSWQGGQMELDPVEVTVYLDVDDQMIGPEGGQWQYEYGMSVQAPAHTVTETTRFQFRPLFTQDPPPDLPPGWQFTHRAFELTAFQFGELHRLNQPIMITLRYDTEDIAGLNHYQLRLWYRRSAGDPWAMLGETYTYEYGQVSVQTDMLGEFILIGQSGNQLFLPLLRK